MAQIDVFGIDALRMADYADNQSSSSSSNDLSRLFFEKCLPGMIRSRKLLLKNNTDVTVKYHWAIFPDEKTLKTNALVAEGKTGGGVFQPAQSFDFSISPSTGVFEPQQVLEFDVKFACRLPFAVYENATLFIDDIPMASAKDVSPHLAAFVAA